LLDATLDPSPEVVRYALRRLRKLGGDTEAAALRQRMLTADVSLVGDFADALAALGDREAAGVAANALRSGDPNLRMAGAIALEVLAGPAEVSSLLGALDDPRAAVRRSSLRALSRLSADWRQCATLLNDRDPGVRAAAAEAVARLAPEPGSLISPLTADPAVEVRRAAARAVAKLPGPEATRLLQDPARSVREVAVHAAGAHQVAALEDVLRDDSVGDLRREAARRLGELGDPSCVDALVLSLSDRDPLVRAVALEALGGLLARRALISRLVSELDNPSAARRRAAVHALAHCQAAEAADELAARIDDPDPETRIAMVRFAEEVLSAGTPLLGRLRADPDPGVANAAQMAAMRRQICG
jgi:HEAT repeat protein